MSPDIDLIEKAQLEVCGDQFKGEIGKYTSETQLVILIETSGLIYGFGCLSLTGSPYADISCVTLAGKDT